MLMMTLPPFTGLVSLLVGAVYVLSAMRHKPSVLDRLEAPDDTEARIDALTRKVRRRSRLRSWLAAVGI